MFSVSSCILHRAGKHRGQKEPPTAEKSRNDCHGFGSVNNASTQALPFVIRLKNSLKHDTRKIINTFMNVWYVVLQNSKFYFSYVVKIK